MNKPRQLSSFLGRNSWLLFSLIDIYPNFLGLPFDGWNHDESYCKIMSFVSQVKVVNDLAEHGIKLISDFNKSINNDESQKQYLLQVVEQHRAKYPVLDKKSLRD